MTDGSQYHEKKLIWIYESLNNRILQRAGESKEIQGESEKILCVGWGMDLVPLYQIPDVIPVILRTLSSNPLDYWAIETDVESARMETNFSTCIGSPGHKSCCASFAEL